MTTQITATYLKQHLGNILKKVVQNKRKYTIFQYGKPIAKLEPAMPIVKPHTDTQTHLYQILANNTKDAMSILQQFCTNSTLQIKREPNKQIVSISCRLPSNNNLSKFLIFIAKNKYKINTNQPLIITAITGDIKIMTGTVEYFVPKLGSIYIKKGENLEVFTEEPTWIESYKLL